eukprot:CAMPEP_0184698854 /NCGR_PEP_ID=MMETSP0313-20130426/5320_1 /TAXON_ID=2792 /ORGANISM="Porphyridium aerugineum, Strain SAG 1380-2" /LENGTH=327 /DNA_ID=CAMNT_0027157845 /DNA_START=93 /DNA_END=1073 /DNA_ORIENTATION=-
MDHTTTLVFETAELLVHGDGASIKILSQDSPRVEFKPISKNSTITASQAPSSINYSNTNNSNSTTGSLFDDVADGSHFDRLRLVKGTNKVVDKDGNVVGSLHCPQPFELQFWTNLYSSLHSLQGSALFEYAQVRELHLSLSSVGELFVLAGSLIASFALGLLQVADLSRVNLAWAIPTALFVTLSFLSSIASVCIASMLFIGVSTTPVDRVHLFASELGSWILRPGQLVYLSFVFLCGEFATIALSSPYPTVGRICVAIIGLGGMFMLVVAMTLMERIVVVRDFVKEDVKRVREEEKLQRKAMRRLKRDEKTKRFKGRKFTDNMKSA